ncbi:MAG: AraC family transcriptional regulator, partial [Hoeflea sp.]|nr:AraC family transcriptional regulator [Hoeflea sp.]
MATTQGIRDYRERLERVRSHIRANLDGPLNLDDLADIACLSRFHWHRTYRGLTGETVWQTVRRLRLHRAASDLVNGTLPIEEIAERSGYTNPRAFSQAFKSDFGLPPLRYRAEGGHRRYDNPDWRETEDMYDVRIEEHEPVVIAGLAHTGPYIDVGAAFERFGSHMAATGGWEKSAGMA